MTAYRQSIRVIYPQDGGRIALRTDENWNADVEAVSRNGYTTEFQVETERPYFYFKPVLRRGRHDHVVARRKLSRYRNVRSPAGGSSILSRRHAVQRVRVDAAARQPLWC